MEQKIQYKVVSGTPSQLEAKLNALARQGWQVVSSSNLSTNEVAVILSATEVG